jgi:hypothetical protein
MPVIKIRRGTTTQWAASTRVLQLGELGLDTTLNKLKAGNGTAIWNNLPFLQADVDITELSQDAVANALAAGTHSNITVTYNDNDNSISLATGPDVITQTSLSNTLTDATTGYVSIGDVGVADGVASLDSNGKIPDSEIPSTIARDSEIPSLTGYATESYVTTAISNLVDTAPTTLNTLNELAAAINDDASFASTVTTALGTKAPIESPTFTGTIGGITKSMVGLGNVDNTTDANKPVSTATQTALDSKLDSSGFTYASITIPVYTSVADLPDASSNHGRWAHVHGEGAMYFAHGGSWYRALSQTDLYISTNSQSSNYTILTSDLGKTIEMSGGGTLTITDSSSFPVGFYVDVLQTSSSQVTIAGTSFTPNATPGLKLRTQWSSATIIKRALDSWVVLGDLSA